MDAQYAELQKSKEELDQKLLRGQTTDKRVCELECEVARLTQELQVRSLQLSDVKRSANEINGSKCVQLVCAQEEIANLKDEMANILNRQYILKREVNKTNVLYLSISIHRIFLERRITVTISSTPLHD